MTSSIKPEQLALLNTPLESLKITAEKLGLNVSDLCERGLPIVCKLIISIVCYVIYSK